MDGAPLLSRFTGSWLLQYVYLHLPVISGVQCSTCGQLSWGAVQHVRHPPARLLQPNMG